MRTVFFFFFFLKNLPSTLSNLSITSRFSMEIWARRLIVCLIFLLYTCPLDWINSLPGIWYIYQYQQTLVKSITQHINSALTQNIHYIHMFWQATHRVITISPKSTLSPTKLFSLNEVITPSRTLMVNHIPIDHDPYTNSIYPFVY